MNRRTFLKRSGLIALGAGAAGLWPRGSSAQPVADAINVELVTVSDTQAVITLDSQVATEALVRWGPSQDSLDHQVQDPKGATRYHRLELNDLQPGTTVHYRIEIDGLEVEPNPYSPGSFETLTPPNGTLLYTFATITDLHVGLTSAGAVGGLSTFEPVECPLDDPTCWQVANRAVVEAINAQGVAFTIAKGDLSHEFRAEEFQAARELLDGLDAPWYAVRGNHDRQGEHPQDLFPAAFGLEKTHYAFDHLGVRFLVLDSSNLETGFPEISEDQWTWFEDQVDALESTQVFFVVLHHAVTEEASAIFSLFGQDQHRLFDALDRKRGLAGILSGHSHRNKVTHQAELGSTPCIETTTTVHYPGGYNLYRIYTGGYMQTHHKVDGQDWRTWEEAGRDMYRGEAQQILMGDLQDRNFVHPFASPLSEPEPEPSTGCSCTTQARQDGPVSPLSVVAGATALAAWARRK